MKIIRDCYNETTENKVVPKEITCECCHSVFEYEPTDLQIGEFGCAYVTCPCCGERLWLDDVDGAKLTKDTIVFPDHFSYSSVATGAVHVEPAQVHEWIRKAVEYFRKNKNEFAYYAASGDTCVVVLRFDGEECYTVLVSQDYYESMIPFEAQDY